MDAMEVYEIKMINRNGSFSIDRLHEYTQVEVQVTDESFTDFFKRELEVHTMKPISQKAYQQTLNKLKVFRKNIYFEDLNFKLVNEFNQFLHRQKLDLNTIKGHHKKIKSIIRLAIKQDLLKVDDNPYKRFDIKGKEPKRVYLTEEELTRIECLTFEQNEKHLERVRDIYLFQTYCLMRYEDVTDVAPEDVGCTEKGLTLAYDAEKTGKATVLPLYALFCLHEGEQSRPEAILQKYLDQLGRVAEVQPDIRLFKITNQYYNRQLKEIARRAEITKFVSSHSARRTGSSILHKRGMPFKAVQKLMQHSSPTMTNIYIQLSDEEIENELKKVQWK